MINDDAGQSLIELALALPLLLILLLGMVDGARAYYFATIMANAAREGVNYAARNDAVTRAEVTQRACDETGLALFGQPCPDLTVTCTIAQDDVAVEVRYDFRFITGYLVDAVFQGNPLSIRAVARYPMLTLGTPCAS